MMMAALTATGGGVIRDILVVEIPAILRSDFYATAAICGGGSFVGVQYFGFSKDVGLVCCILVTCGLRFMAIRYGISLPKIESLPLSPSKLTRQRRESKD